MKHFKLNDVSIVLCFLTVYLFRVIKNYTVLIIMIFFTEFFYWSAFNCWPLIARQSLQYNIADPKISATIISLLNSFFNISWCYSNTIVFFISDFINFESLFVFSAIILTMQIWYYKNFEEFISKKRKTDWMMITNPN